MSLYNMLHGVNPLTGVLLEALSLTADDTGRFRDIFYDFEKEQIIIYTRNGGGNRETYQSVFDKLSKHPEYVTDYDDDYDCTYAYIVFNVPKQFKELFKVLMPKEKVTSIHEKFEASLKAMKGMTAEELERHPNFGQLMQILKKMNNDITNPKRNKPGDINIYKV